jgi:hypothetical protein
MEPSELTLSLRHDIDETILTETETDGFFSSTFLHDDPLATYLTENESVYYVLWAEATPQHLPRRTSVPEAALHRTIVAVTDTRIVVLIGTTEDDYHYDLPLVDIESLTLETTSGMLRSRTTLQLATPEHTIELDNQSSADLESTASDIAHLASEAKCGCAAQYLARAEREVATCDFATAVDQIMRAVEWLENARTILETAPGDHRVAIDEMSERIAELETRQSVLSSLTDVKQQWQHGEDRLETPSAARNVFEQAETQLEDVVPAAEATPEADRVATLQTDMRQRLRSVTPTAAHEQLSDLTETICGVKIDDSKRDQTQTLQRLQEAVEMIDDYEGVLEDEFDLTDAHASGCDICGRDVWYSWTVTVAAESQSVCAWCKKFGTDGPFLQESELNALRDEYATEAAAVLTDEESIDITPHSEILLTALRTLSDELGRPPSYQEFGEATPFDGAALTTRFGSWGEVLGEAGIDLRSALLEEIDRLDGELPLRLAPADLYAHSDYPRRLFEEEFDSPSAAIRAAGATRLQLSNEPWITEIGDLALELERPPKRDEVAAQTSIDLDDLHAEFGPYAEVLAVAGVDEPSTDDIQADLLAEIQRVAAAVEHRPSRAELKAYSEFPLADFTNQFDSVADATDTASLSVSDTRTPIGPLDEAPDAGADVPSHTDLLRELAWLVQRHGKSTAREEFDDLCSFDLNHYELQFGSAGEAFDILEEGRTSNGDNFVLKAALEVELNQLGDFLKRPPMLLDVLYFSQYPLAKYADKFDSLTAVRSAAGYDAPSASQIPSTEALLQDLKESGTGEPPTIAEYEWHGDYQYAQLIRRFDSWLAALAAAGFDPLTLDIETIRGVEAETDRLRSESLLRLDLGLGVKPVLLDELHRFHHELGRQPTEAIVSTYGRYPVAVFERAFGSLDNAVAAADLPATSDASADTEYQTQLIDSLQDLKTNWEHPPTKRMVNARGEYPAISYLTIFGSWEHVLEEAGLDSNAVPDVSAAVLLADLQRVGELLGDDPSAEEIFERGSFSRPSYLQPFQDMKTVRSIVDPDTPLTETGIPAFSDDQSSQSGSDRDTSTSSTSEDTDTSTPSQSDLIEELQRVDSQKDTTNATVMRDEGKCEIHHYTQQFGSWNEALAAAGIDTEQRLLDEIAQVWKKVGEPPTTTEMNEFGKYSSGLITTYFESWTAAIKACEEEYDVPSDDTETASSEEPDSTSTAVTTDDSQTSFPSRSELIHELQRVDEEEGALTSSQMSEYGHYDVDDYTEEFGSWEGALFAADIDTETRLLDELARLPDETGERPLRVQMKMEGRYSPSLYTSYFGSWGKAVEICEKTHPSLPDSPDETSADDNPSSPSSSSRETSNSPSPSRSELITELQRVDERYGAVNSTAMQDNGDYQVHQYTNEFGSWNEALEAAGIDKEARLLEELAHLWDEVGERPTSTQMDEADKYSMGLYTQYFGNWGNAIDACRETHDVLIEDTAERSSTDRVSDSTSTADDQSDSADPSREALVAELRRLDDELDRVPKAGDMTERGKFKRSQYWAEFESWDDALEAADIDKEAYLLDELERVWRKVGSRPSTTDMMNTHGTYSAGTYAKYFGNWQGTIATLKQTRSVANLPDETTVSSPDETKAAKSNNDGLPAEQLDSNIVSIEEISDNARLDGTLLVRCTSVKKPQGDRKAHTLLVKDYRGNTCRLNTWTKHDLSIDWKEGNWYLLEEVRGKVWGEEGNQTRQLSSTRDLTVTEFGTGISRETIQAAIDDSSMEAGTGTDSKKPDPSDDSQSDDSEEDTGILGDVMGEF